MFLKKFQCSFLACTGRLKISPILFFIQSIKKALSGIPGEVLTLMPTMKKLWFRGSSKSAISFTGLTVEDSKGKDDSWNDGGMAPPMMRWPPMGIKRQGETICEGHRNYELML